MKLLSIRGKVTLWYTLFMIGLVAVILGVLVEVANTAILINQKEQLMKVVAEAVEDLEDSDKENNESFDYWEDGIYLLHYDENQQYLNGSAPSSFPDTIPLLDKKVQTVKNTEEVFYVYDRLVQNIKAETIWIRGITSNTQSDQMSKAIIGMSFILLPVLVVLSSFIGYHITKRAFKPVRQIQETAQQIADSQELSMRIGLPAGNDEISKLGQTVDVMLDKLEKSFEKEKQFTSDASHELRTPISVILTESEYMLSHSETFEEAKESMEVINRQANKLTELINQLLFFARSENGNLELHYEPVNLPIMVQEIVESNFNLCQSAHIFLSMQNEMEETAVYSIDKTLISRAIQNIIQNAITYGKENGKVEIILKESKSYWAVKVTDNGIGIEKEHLDKIWDRFYQVNPSRNKTGTNSMGLGLSMVKWIVDKHKGYIEVESTPLKGSSFILYFPKN